MWATPLRISNLRLFALGVLAALGASVSGLAVAQNAQAPASSQQLQAVVVTAEYREEKLQNTPIAITAITAADIQAQGAITREDIALNAPSVNVRLQPPPSGRAIRACSPRSAPAGLRPAVQA